MKTVKSGLLGKKELIDSSPDELLLQFKDIIKQHRSVVINSLLANVPTYVDYKFELKLDADQLAKMKDELIRLQESQVDLKNYDSIVEQLINRPIVHLTNQPFYKEIDECLLEITKINVEQ